MHPMTRVLAFLTILAAQLQCKSINAPSTSSMFHDAGKSDGNTVKPASASLDLDQGPFIKRTPSMRLQTIRGPKSLTIPETLESNIHMATNIATGTSDGITSVDGDLEGYTSTFEVMKPVVKPAGAEPCAVLPLMTNHLFANSPPPFLSWYNPPENCSQSWSLVTLTWSAHVIGRQYDRVADVFFDGLEVLKTTTEEPSSTGVKWVIEIDISNVMSFLKKRRKVKVTLDNVVDSTYTGIYNVSLSLTFFEGPTSSHHADVIVPLSLEDSGLSVPFGFTNGSDSSTVAVKDLPRNVYRAEIHILQNQGGNDEFYWADVPSQYVEQLPKADQNSFFGGGVFRETLTYIDGQLVASTWPFPVIYTGGVNPYFWRPVVGIGAFVLPYYRLDVTPFVGWLVDGKEHNITFQVVGVLTDGAWSLSGALHLWLDKGSVQTRGGLLVRNVAPKEDPEVSVSFRGTIDADIITKASRVSQLVGWVSTSFGNLTSTVDCQLSLNSENHILDDGWTSSTFHIVTARQESILALSNGSTFGSISESFEFPLDMFIEVSQSEGGSVYSLFGSYWHGFNFNKSMTYADREPTVISQRNIQKGGGMYSTAYPGFGYSSQNFTYLSSLNDCYTRKYSQNNYKFKFDVESFSC